MEAKTFPIRTVDVFLEKVREAAKQEGVSMHKFILDAINEKLEKN